MSKSIQDEIIKKESLFGAQNYSPLSVVLERGEGAYLWDVDGNKYEQFATMAEAEAALAAGS